MKHRIDGKVYVEYELSVYVEADEIDSLEALDHLEAAYINGDMIPVYHDIELGDVVPID